MNLIPLLQSLKTADNLKRLAVEHLNFSPEPTLLLFR